MMERWKDGKMEWWNGDTARHHGRDGEMTKWVSARRSILLLIKGAELAMNLMMFVVFQEAWSRPSHTLGNAAL